MTEDPWLRAIPEKYIPGHIIKGKVAKLTNFGAFVELEPDLEGLLHISELADHKVDKPQDVVKVGDEVEVKILKVDTDSRKIGLSLRRVQWAEEEAAEAEKPRRKPAGPERVISDADMDRLVRPKEKTDRDTEQADTEAPKEHAAAEAQDTPEEPAPPGSDDTVSQTDTQQAMETQEKKEEKPEQPVTEPSAADTKEEKAEDESKAKGAKSSILNVFKRRKKETSQEKAEEPEQAGQSAEASAQPPDDSATEQQNEQA
jgi:predicted RNA-binding protein with RPS1 domain